MLDTEGYTAYIRAKINLEIRMTEQGKDNIKEEVTSQAYFVEERLVAKIKQAYWHAEQELHGLKIIYDESLKKEVQQCLTDI